MPAYKLVRDPFSRAVSSYLMMLVLGDDSGHFTVDLRRELRAWLYGDPAVPYGFGFAQFLEWLSTCDVAAMNDHLAPQSTALEDLLPDLRLVRLEDFERELRSIEADLGLDPADYDRITESGHHTSRAANVALHPAAVVALQPPIPFGDHPIPPTTSFVTPTTVDLVRRIYADDYARYGYEPPRPGRSPFVWRVRELVRSRTSHMSRSRRSSSSSRAR